MGRTAPPASADRSESRAGYRRTMGLWGRDARHARSDQARSPWYFRPQPAVGAKIKRVYFPDDPLAHAGLDQQSVDVVRTEWGKAAIEVLPREYGDDAGQAMRLGGVEVGDGCLGQLATDERGMQHARHTTPSTMGGTQVRLELVLDRLQAGHPHWGASARANTVFGRSLRGILYGPGRTERVHHGRVGMVRRRHQRRVRPCRPE